MFPGGPINNLPMDGRLCFFLFNLILLFFLLRLALVTMTTLPAQGMTHASAQPTMLSCWHSREVTLNMILSTFIICFFSCWKEKQLTSFHRDSSWLTGIKMLISSSYTSNSVLPYRPAPSFFIHQNGPVAILVCCLFFQKNFFLPSWSPDGIWAPVQLHQLLHRYFSHCLVSVSPFLYIFPTHHQDVLHCFCFPTLLTMSSCSCLCLTLKLIHTNTTLS